MKVFTMPWSPPKKITVYFTLMMEIAGVLA